MEASDLEYQPATLSPKVYVPLVLALLAIAVQWFITGSWDKQLTGQAILVAGYALFGVTAPPAPGVKQREVQELVRAKQQAIPAVGREKP